jgi:hypothetical protein
MDTKKPFWLPKGELERKKIGGLIEDEALGRSSRIGASLWRVIEFVVRWRW